MKREDIDLDPDGLVFPRLGNYFRAQQFIIRDHKCWRDRLPWVGPRHLLKMVRKAHPEWLTI